MHVCTYILYDALFKCTPPHKVAVTCIPQCLDRTSPVDLTFLSLFFFPNSLSIFRFGGCKDCSFLFLLTQVYWQICLLFFFCRFGPGALYHLPVQSKGLEQFWPRFQSCYNSNYPWGETVGGGPTSLASSRWKRRHRPTAVASACQT